MAATSRWVQFESNTDTYTTIKSSNAHSGTGTIGYALGQIPVSGTLSIVAGVADQIQVGIDGGAVQPITLTAGANLDCRAVARDITFKLKQIIDPKYDLVMATYENNRFKIYSSSMGVSSRISISYGNANDCLYKLGMAVGPNTGYSIDYLPGTSGSNSASYTGQATLGGVYKGQFDDIYTVIVGANNPVSGCVEGPTNTYDGIVTVGGDWNGPAAETYTVTIGITGGSTMNNGAGSVPTITWESSRGDDETDPTELLYQNYWYNIGTKGVRIKFSDGVFAEGDTFTIYCTPIVSADGVGSTMSATVGNAKYVWSSRREGNSSSATTTHTVGTAVGTKGVTIAFEDSGSLTKRDTYRIICSGPQPTVIGVTILNFGSVTVSTYSPTKVVWFELLSGATQLLTPKFGLQSHGLAHHHNENNADTFFAFGSSGEGFPAVVSGQKTEWKKDIIANIHLNSDVPPAGILFQTENNMPVVQTADQSIALGVAPGTMVSDFVYLAVKLGALETGQNPSICWRAYYDFS